MNRSELATTVYTRLGIFGIAMAVRSVLAFIYCGSCDIDAFINITKHTMANDLTSLPYWNYFPAISIYLWLSGYLTVMTDLPIAFCMKIIPCLFDSLLAVLVFDMCCMRNYSYSWQAALAYALCPVLIIVDCIHGQWDIVFLFFLVLSFYVREYFADSASKYFWFGLLFAIAIFIKPVALMYTPFFFTPYRGLREQLGEAWHVLQLMTAVLMSTIIGCFCIIKLYDLSLRLIFMAVRWYLLAGMLLALIGGIVALVHAYKQKMWQLYAPDFIMYLRYQAWAVAGGVFIFGIGLIACTLLGFNLLTLFDHILRYCNQGVQLLGVPFAYPFDHGPLHLILKNRIWLLAVFGLLAWYYYREHISALQAVMLCNAFVIALCGYCPNYLMWLVPFLCINGNIGFMAVYGTIGGIFHALFYSNLFSNAEVAYQSGLSFAPLLGYKSFFPPAWCNNGYITDTVRLLGNYILPLLCLLFIIHFFKRLFTTHVHAYDILCERPVWRWYYDYQILLQCIFLVSILVLMMCYRTVPFGELIKPIIIFKKFWYYRLLYHGRWVTHYTGNPVVNMVVLLIIASVAWGWCTWRFARERRIK